MTDQNQQASEAVQKLRSILSAFREHCMERAYDDANPNHIGVDLSLLDGIEPLLTRALAPKCDAEAVGKSMERRLPDDGGMRLAAQVRGLGPLDVRLAQVRERVAKMCSEHRSPRMCVPPECNDDDIFIVCTIEDALMEIETLRACLKVGESPCGHSDQYAHSEDGGKTVHCYVCENARLNERVRELEQQLEIVRGLHNSACEEFQLAAQGRNRLSAELARVKKDWIPVTERLPEHNKIVLAFCGGGFMATFHRPNNGDYWFRHFHTQQVERVTHWMPLPEPPAISAIAEAEGEDK